MAKLGDERRAYLVSAGPDYTVLAGEQSNTLTVTSDQIETSEKGSSWQDFIAGILGATAEITVYADDTDDEQTAFLEALADGDTVKVFIGQLAANDTPYEGDVFEAIVAGASDTNDNGSVSTRAFSLTATGEVVHYPVID